MIDAAPGGDGDEIAVGDAERLGEQRMHLAQRFRVLGDERGDAPGLGARQVLRHDPARGQQHRVVVVDDLGGRLVRHRVEAGLAVGVEEPAALEQSGGAGVAGFGDGPEQAHLVLDALPGGAGVVGRAAGAGPAELVEDLFGVRVREVLALAQPFGDVEQDLPVTAGLAGWGHGGVDLDDPSLPAGRGAFVLLVQRSGQHDVGVVAGFGEEEVDDRVELERVECLRG